MATTVEYEATSTMRYTLPVTSAKLAVVQVRHDSAAVRHEPTLLRMLHCVRLYSDLRFDGFGSDELARILMHVQSMSNDRVIESSSLRELNSRLASYLEQCRYFEVANRVLTRQLMYVRSSLNKAAESVGALYEMEIENVRRLLEESQRRTEDSRRKVEKLITEREALIEKRKLLKRQSKSTQDEITQYLLEITEFQCRCTILRGKVERVEQDNASMKAENFRMRQLMNTMNVDLDAESLNRMRAESKAHNLSEEIAFQRLEWDNIKRELDKLINTEVPVECRSYWQFEVNVMIAALFNDFESRSEALKLEFETRYNTKVREIKTKFTQDSIEFDSLKNDLDRIQRAKSSLLIQLEQIEPAASSLEKRMLSLREDYEPRIKRLQEEITTMQTQRTEAESHIKKLYDEIQNLLKLKVTLEVELKRYRSLLQRDERLRSPRTSDSNLIRIERRFEVVKMRHEVKSLGPARASDQGRVHSESEKPEGKQLRVPRMAESAMWISPPQVSAKH